jgi:hypothetical protein
VEQSELVFAIAFPVVRVPETFVTGFEFIVHLVIVRLFKLTQQLLGTFSKVDRILWK